MVISQFVVVLTNKFAKDITGSQKCRVIDAEHLQFHGTEVPQEHAELKTESVQYGGTLKGTL